ncbi:MAG: hypothetical protein U0103_17790 [Candidatus Obscuribacterales bacterium]
MKSSNSAKLVGLTAAFVGVLTLTSDVSSLSQTSKVEKSPYKSTEEARLSNHLEGAHISLKAPSNFPLPVYSSNIISTNFTNTTKGVPMADLTLITRDDGKGVFEWYKVQCVNMGWQVRTPKQSAMGTQEKAGRLFVLNAIKGQQQGNITVSRSVKHPETVINVVWMKQN